MFDILVFAFILMVFQNCGSDEDYIDNRVITSLKESKYFVHPFVVNGEPAFFGQIPYYVAIKKPRRSLKHHNWPPLREDLYKNICGGCIISKSKVLTAAHCFEPNDFFYATHPETLRLVAGTLNSNVVLLEGTNGTNSYDYRRDEKFMQWRKVHSVLIHSNYQFPIADIAFVVLQSPWIYTDTVSSVDVATINKDYLDSCIAAGFGRVGYDFADQNSGVLLVAKMNIFTMDQCSDLWEMNMSEYVCSNSKFSDVARGDSGGPLVCRDDSRNPFDIPRDILVGIVSGKNFDKTTLFTRVSYYKDWFRGGDEKVEKRTRDDKSLKSGSGTGISYEFIMFFSVLLLVAYS